MPIITFGHNPKVIKVEISHSPQAFLPMSVTNELPTNSVLTSTGSNDQKRVVE